jgi:hypothetical protein
VVSKMLWGKVLCRIEVAVAAAAVTAAVAEAVTAAVAEAVTAAVAEAVTAAAIVTKE